MLEKPAQLHIPVRDIGLTLIVVLGMYILTKGNFLFIHSVIEGICIVVGGLIYILGTQTFKFSQDKYLRFLGCAYFYIAFLDGLHLLTFEGMGVFSELGQNTSNQIWLAARYIEALSFVVVHIVVKYNTPPKICSWVLGGITGAASIAIIRFQWFPTCYITEVGLTPFKVASEYVIILILLLSMYQMNRKKETIEPVVYQAVILALGATALSEFCFTLYVSTRDAAMIIGHILKLVSFGFIFWGTILRGLDMPYNTIFKELKEKNERLKSLNEKKNEFIGIAAHDLRNPLTIITMSSQVLSRSNGLDERQIKFLERIRTSSEYMQHLVEELLDYTKIEAGKVSLNLAPCELVSIVENSVSLNQTVAVDKQIQLVFSYQEEIPSLLLDGVKMEQVVNNLITNAIKYSFPNTSVQIELFKTVDEVILLVKDEGQGIPAHEIPQIFSPYAKTSVKTTGGEKSTGLGLAISRKIVEGHHGRIWVESEVGTGSRFYVALPRIPVVTGRRETSLEQEREIVG